MFLTVSESGYKTKLCDVPKSKILEKQLKMLDSTIYNGFVSYVPLFFSRSRFQISWGGSLYTNGLYTNVCVQNFSVHKWFCTQMSLQSSRLALFLLFSGLFARFSLVFVAFVRFLFAFGLFSLIAPKAHFHSGCSSPELYFHFSWPPTREYCLLFGTLARGEDVEGREFGRFYSIAMMILKRFSE